MKRNKIFALIVSGTLLTSILGTSCGIQNNQQLTEVTVDPMYTYDGTHIYTAPDTDKWLVKDGKTDYVLVLPEQMNSYLLTARNEFVDLFSDATGIEISFVSENAVTDASAGKYISIGKTSLLEETGVEIDQKELSSDGHRIVTVDDDVYICGGTDEGSIFGVYTFMRLTFNYETYTFDCMEIERTANKALKKYDVTDIPDFKLRVKSSNTIASSDYDESMFATRMRYNGTRSLELMNVHKNLDASAAGAASTNVAYWFPEETFDNVDEHPDTYHPKWFSDNGGEQACFTAHGDETEYEAMLKHAFDTVEFTLKLYQPDEYPKKNAISLTHADNMNYCTCKACLEVMEHYDGSVASTQILFMNDLAERVQKLLDDNKDASWYRENFTIYFFAYNMNWQAPARYNVVTKEYEPIDEKVILHPLVGAYIAVEAYVMDSFEAPSNVSLQETMLQWKMLAQNSRMYLWNYGANYQCYLWPSPAMQHVTRETYAWYANISDNMWFIQLQDKNRSRNTVWQSLVTYLDSKLCWDTSLDEQELINKYFNALYKDAAPTMLRLLQQERAYINKVILGDHKATGRINYANMEYFPMAILQQWLAEHDQAKQEVLKYKTAAPELYDSICKNIETEALFPLYMLMDLYGINMSQAEREQYVSRLEHDLVWLELSNMITSPDGALFSNWVANLR